MDEDHRGFSARARQRAVHLLIAVFAIDFFLAGALRVDAFRELLHGSLGWRPVLGTIALLWIPLLLGCLVVVLRHLGGLQHAVTDREDHIAAVEATSHDWLWQASPELVVTYCSPSVSGLLGYQPDSLVGRSFLEFLTPRSAEEARRILDEAVRTRTGWRNVELDWIHADGSTVRLQGGGVPILDSAERLLGFRGTRRRPSAEADLDRRFAMLRHRVKDVIAQRSIVIALQPIVAVGTGRLCGFEALARFPDSRRPDLWFAEAHEVGLGVELELVAFEEAIAIARHLPRDVYVSVNASPSLVLDPRFRAAAESSALDRLTVEITEHAVIDEYDEITASLLPLRERGVALAVDDTGAGYASFSHVLRLRPDTIKLDRSLISQISTDAAARALVTAVVLLALELGAAVTAEGVETTAELRGLQTLGVDNVQGYLLGRPSLDPDQWRRWQHKQWAGSATVGAEQALDLAAVTPTPAIDRKG